jgi:hypothetical protein
MDRASLAARITPDESDQTFLVAMMEKFPRVEHGFRQFEAAPPMGRIPLAFQVLNEQTRTGWLRFDLEEGASRDITAREHSEYYGRDYRLFEDSPKTPETVLEHSAEAGELYAVVFSKPSLMRTQWGNEVMKFHDFAESIIGDFTPRDDITKPEKARLEGIALDFLTQSRHDGNLHALHVYNCMQIYEGRKTDYAEMQSEFLGEVAAQERAGRVQPRQREAIGFFKRLYSEPKVDLKELYAEAHDSDLLQMGVRGLRMMREEHSRLPEKESCEKMEEFWTWIDKKITTEQGRDFFDTLRGVYVQEPAISYKDSLTTAITSSEKAYRSGTPRF